MHELQTNVVVDQFLDGLAYPVSKRAILEGAHEARLPDPVIEAFGALPDRDYADGADVARALNSA